MQTVIEKLMESDLILWSFPLYYFNVPGILKNLIDRQLPMSLPFMSARQDGYGSGSHEARYDMEGKRHVLISTCGFYSASENYDSVSRMFDHFLNLFCLPVINQIPSATFPDTPSFLPSCLPSSLPSCLPIFRPASIPLLSAVNIPIL